MNLRTIIATLRLQQKTLTTQVEFIDSAIAALSRLGGRAPGGRKRRTLSAAGRARIVAVQRARWAKIRAAKKA